MLEITNGKEGRINIYLTRGDTARLKLVGENYTFTNEDTVILTAKKTVNDTTYLFQDVMLDSEIKIKQEDTASLDYGTYVYDIQVTFANGDVLTLYRPSDFVIGNEVTN